MVLRVGIDNEAKNLNILLSKVSATDRMKKPQSAPVLKTQPAWIAALASLATATPALAQIVPDATLPNNMSACQTATGDNRAGLGLAGVAVRSGARSTLATLWSVQDNSTARLIVEFYRQLTNPQISKAEALRRAQVAMLKGEYKPPYFWAPFVLVGNWQ